MTELDTTYDLAYAMWAGARNRFVALLEAKIGRLAAEYFPEADELVVEGEDDVDGYFVRAQRVTAAGQLIAGYRSSGAAVESTSELWDDFTDEIDPTLLDLLAGISGEDYRGEHTIPVPGPDVDDLVIRHASADPFVCIDTTGQVHLLGDVEFLAGRDADELLAEAGHLVAVPYEDLANGLTAVGYDARATGLGGNVRGVEVLTGSGRRYVISADDKWYLDSDEADRSDDDAVASTFLSTALVPLIAWADTAMRFDHISR